MTAIICMAKEIDPPSGVDLRTRAGREREVIEQVRQYGGFSIFWVTEHQTRACAADRLLKRGEIVRDLEQPFPWCACRLKDSARENAHG